MNKNTVIKFLIIFAVVVAATFLFKPKISIRTETSGEMRTEEEIPKIDGQIIFIVDANGKITHNNKQIKLEDFPSIINNSESVHVETHQSIPYETIQPIVIKLAEIGITDVNFHTTH